MRTQYQQCHGVHQGRNGPGPGSDVRGAGHEGPRSNTHPTNAPARTFERMRRRLGARLPPRIVMPFLLFWCLGSLVLGHELASLPLASFASAVTRPLQATLQVQGIFPRTASPGASSAARQPGASQQLTAAATGLLGRKVPVMIHARTTKARARSKSLTAGRRVYANVAVTHCLSQRSRANASEGNTYPPAFGAWSYPAGQMPGEFDGAQGWYAFPWQGSGGGTMRAPWESAGRYWSGVSSPSAWMGLYDGE